MRDSSSVFIACIRDESGFWRLLLFFEKQDESGRDVNDAETDEERKESATST